MSMNEENPAFEDYQLFIHPSFLTVREMSKEQAKEYFQWFLTQIPLRLYELRQVLDNTGKSKLALDFSSESFMKLSKWIDQYAQSRPLTIEELEEGKKTIPSWLHKDIPPTIKNELTRSLCADIGIYFGEIFRRKYPFLRWDFVQKPKSDIDYHQPVVVTFNNKIELNPISVINNIVGKKVDKRGANKQPNIFDVWDEYFSTGKISSIHS
jgi:hypothetical protein